MTATLSLEATPRLEQRVSPELLAYAEMLALPTLELESVVEREIDRNPALERIESSTCPQCGEHGSPCSCRSRARRTNGDTHPAIDRVDEALPDHPTTADALLAQLRPLVKASELPILSYVVGSLDQRGFIDMTASQIARRLQLSAEAVEAVLSVLRRHGPAGVGAGDLRECLLLQLTRLEEEGRGDPLARAIVDRHLHLLAAGRRAAIATVLEVSLDEVAAAARFIKLRLRPYAALDLPHSAPVAPPALPDVIVRELPHDRGAFAIHIVERDRVRVVLAPAYQRVAADALAPAERARLETHVGQARAFLTRLERRWETMRAVTEGVVGRQRDYLTRGPRYMKRLTRSEVADAVGVHESTVSRATNGRYVMLPQGRVAPFSIFFEHAQGPCAALAKLIADEREPRSDAALAADLARQGFPIARRTVAKYRCRLGIASHTER